jgi:ribosomal-protein-alanine N-acetyltransferase
LTLYHRPVEVLSPLEVVGPKLTLRYPIAADAPALLGLGSDEAVTRFFSWGPYTTLAEPAGYIADLAAERERGERLEFLIVARGAGPIGITGLSEYNRRDRRAVIGTWLGHAHWGTGANTESKALVAHLAFRGLGLERLSAYADVENARSQTALTRLGFVREGVLRHWHRHGDVVKDVVLYSWLRDEWERSSLAELPVFLRGDLPEAFMNAAAPS